MASSNIFSQYLQAPKSVIDYQNEYDQRDANRLGIEGRRQQNAMQAMTMQQTQRTMADSTDDRNALQRIAAGWTAETTPDAKIASLRNSGRPGLMSQADALEKADIERTKGRAAAGKDQAETDKIKLATDYMRRDRHLQGLANVTTPQQAAAWIDEAAALGEASPQQFEQVKQGVLSGQIPLDQWKQRAQRGGMTLQQQAQQRLEELQRAETERHNQATEGLTARGQDIGASTSRRGQDMVDARTREQIGQGKVPAGYRQLPGGNMQAIPGGPADLKQIGALNADTQALTGSISGFDRLATAANEVLKHPGLAGITGLRGALPNILGGDAANAQALLGTLKSQIGFGVLQDMRNNSKTGGALGNVSDAEGKRLEDNLAALDRSQSLEQYQANLRKIVDYAEQAKGRVREAYNLKHGNRAVQPSDDRPPAINDLLKKYGG